ncbi:MAG: mannose-6-phosphate isomerase, class I [Desulfobacterales bacterium]|nr:mannose-6-phosphate isomerase, class I [Desulfobacterales bacterium]
MDRIYRLKNVIQPYAWGSRTAIAELLGDPFPSETPQAELWMGAHPKAPSKVNHKGRWVPLDGLIEANPVSVLGPAAARRFDNHLPYLFKVLAAAEPLSIQAHPSRQQAQEGFERENRAGIPMDAPHRNYRDSNHKPEIICALTRFWALCGFRTWVEMRDNLLCYCPDTLSGELERVECFDEPRRIRSLFETLMTLSDDLRQVTVAEALSSAEGHGATVPEAFWLKRIGAIYPDDIGVLSPLLLNLVCLDPGQALFLPAGQLHAYLEGTGIELMANSDNVLRGGLTPKHVDLPELMKILRFEPLAIKRLALESIWPGERRYQAPAHEFALSEVKVVGDGTQYRSAHDRSADILLCTDGSGVIQWGPEGETLPIEKGAAFLAPAGAGVYGITGNTILYKASVLLSS